MVVEQKKNALELFIVLLMMLSNSTPFDSSPINHTEATKALVSLQCQVYLLKT